MFDIKKIVRKNIFDLKPYSSARNEYTGNGAILLDANENPFETSYNRYPSPLHTELKQKISELKGVDIDRIFLGNGSDEAIDLLIRAFCEPRCDNLITIDPSYGMYSVCAGINAVECRKVLLTEAFQLESKSILAAVDNCTKLIILCSPNNPTANSLDTDEVIRVITRFNGLVVLDEAYIDFSTKESFLRTLDQFPNLVVLQTFSKAWGMAGLRLGMAAAASEVVLFLNKIKYPYNLNRVTQEIALTRIGNEAHKNMWVKAILEEKALLMNKIGQFGFVEKIYPSDANFFLVRVTHPRKIYRYLIEHRIVVRDRSNQSLCKGCLRFTVGTKKENKILIDALSSFK